MTECFDVAVVLILTFKEIKRRRLTDAKGVGLSFQAVGLSSLHAVELSGWGRIAALTASLRA
jgi:hypothetical protein